MKFNELAGGVVDVSGNTGFLMEFLRGARIHMPIQQENVGSDRCGRE